VGVHRRAGLRQGTRYWLADAMPLLMCLTYGSLEGVLCKPPVFCVHLSTPETPKLSPVWQPFPMESIWFGKRVVPSSLQCSSYVCSASEDNIRLWNVHEAPVEGWRKKGLPPFRVIPGHHGGLVSQIREYFTYFAILLRLIREQSLIFVRNSWSLLAVLDNGLGRAQKPFSFMTYETFTKCSCNMTLYSP